MCYVKPGETRRNLIKKIPIVILTDIITSAGLWLFCCIDGCFKIVIEEQTT